MSHTRLQTALRRYPQMPALLLGGSFLIVQLGQLALLIFSEKVEYDTFTFYFSKVELMRWWTPERHPVMTFVQEFLPIGFTKLQMLFAAGNYARNAMNFLVAIGGAVYLGRQVPRLFFPFVFLVLANTAFFMQYTGYKSDAPFAVLSIVLIHIVSRCYFPCQLSVIAALSLLILSIKWSGGIVLLVAAGLYLPTFGRAVWERPRAVAIDLLVALAVSAMLFNFLELGIYLEAYQKTGSFTPTQTLGVAPLSFGLKNLAVGLAQYLLVSVVETFEPLWRWLSNVDGIQRFLELATLGTKNYIIHSPGQMRQSINGFDALGLAASVGVLVRWYRERRIDVFVRNCAIAALFVTGVMLAAYPYQPYWANRFFLPAQVLSYIPLAYVAMSLWRRMLRARHRAERGSIVLMSAALLAASHITLSASMVIRDPERTFRGWQSFQPVYLAMQNTMTRADPLDIVFDTRAADVDYTYPYLRQRDPSNTTLSDIQGGGFSPRSTNVLCFSATTCAAVASSGAYAQIADGGPTISLWCKH
jgi:hypothetical protein